MKTMLIFVLTTFYINVSNSQVSYSVTLGPGSVLFDYDTGVSYNYDDYLKLYKDYPNMHAWPKEYNKYGMASSFYFDKNEENSRTISNGLFNDKVSEGEIFSEFVMKTIDGQIVESKNLRGKKIVLISIVMLREPFFNKDQLLEMDSFFSDLPNVKSIVFTSSNSLEIEDAIGDLNLNSLIVPEAMGFQKKYGIKISPQYVLIDENGLLVKYFKHEDLGTFEDMLKN
ncbi:hypothetical protein [Zhouia amylolytica]|uniref:Thioredoxin domain-containing protein n=1 Tax=Zhouia amylolytica AD3 TaxID=1286632 RepID=W2UK68_9FLAO|nr:hypothetical protein [Zhouia amylolytica]ETN94393.1 hypothetical protein P278_23350 [Zhouia amylolytica AD3]